jgi:GT2 family glycosyltransferase
VTSSGHPKLSIIFLNYNRLKDTMLTVDRLRGLVGGRRDTEVIAVDNGSLDGTAEYLKGHSHWMRVLALDENTGIAGLNRGFCEARGQYIMVLDDDSHPRDSATINQLIARLDSRPDIGVLAFRIELPDGRSFRTWHLPETDAPGPAMCFVGCGFAIRRELFKRIGWFPEAFFLYQNEIETAIRVMKAGYGIFFDPACRVVHRESRVGRTSWRRVYYPTRNTLWIIRRYFPSPAALTMIASRLVIGLIRAVQSGQFRWYLAAVGEGLGSPIPREPLSLEIRKCLLAFERHNSVVHHLIGIARSLGATR